MAFILQGTADLLTYWNALGKPCDLSRLASAINSPIINLMGSGKSPIDFNAQYDDDAANDLADALGVAVSDVTANAGQIQI